MQQLASRLQTLPSCTPHRRCHPANWNVRAGRRSRQPCAASTSDGNQAKASGVSDDASRMLADAEALMSELSAGRPQQRQQPCDPQEQQQQEEQSALQEDTGGFQELRCDVHGCTIVPLAAGASSGKGLTGSMSGMVPAKLPGRRNQAAPKDFRLYEGPGWKLGYDAGSASGSEMSALIGNDQWSLALTQAEYEDFVRLLRNLRHSVQTLQICGEWATDSHERADATLEMSTERVWLQGRAPQKRLSALQAIWRRRTQSRATSSEAGQAAFSLRFIISSEGQREVEGRWTAEATMLVLEHLDKEEGARGVAKALPEQQMLDVHA